MGTVREDLQGRGLDLLETHFSWVFLGDREVWKVKKPVSLGFLDFSTPAKRREACEAEVRPGRRVSSRGDGRWMATARSEAAFLYGARGIDR